MNTTTSTEGFCTTETVLLSLSTGFSAAIAIASCAWIYLMRRSTTTIPCPYCDAPFEKAVVREHLQTCPEHLKNYKRQGRATIVQELDRKAYYSLSVKKMLAAAEDDANRPLASEP